MTTITPVILCGGSGTRLWPVSRESYPKQFLPIYDDLTLFEHTLKRIEYLKDTDQIIVICNEKYKFYVKNICKKYSVKVKIILEPAQRDTAAAISLAAFSLLEKNNDVYMLVLPADHQINHAKAFCDNIINALNIARQNYIITFGIKPSRPETGFGYIEQGFSIDNGYSVASFVEKPDAPTAQKMIESGRFVWNSGIFLMRPSLFLDELKIYEPDMESACKSAWENHKEKNSFFYPEKNSFLSSPAKSIDYAIMEKTDKAAVLPLDIEWNDLGSWERIYQISQKDKNDNALSGDVIIEGSNGCYINARSRLVTALGVRDLSIIETQDAVLVASRKNIQNVKKIVSLLKIQQRDEYKYHPLVYRPWGSYESLARGERFQVKRIIVNPGEELSLQLHHHRAEHWIVVSGTAEVTNGDTIYMITENQSTFIPIGTKHRLKNPGIIPLVLIEIQSGAYLGEDDIVRFADIYDRDV